MAGEEPYPGVFKTAGIEYRRQQRRDVITQPEAITVQQLDGVQNFAVWLFVSPAGDVIPEAGFDEASVGKEKAPDGFGFLRSPDYNYLPGPDDIYVSRAASEPRPGSRCLGPVGGDRWDLADLRAARAACRPAPQPERR